MTDRHQALMIAHGTLVLLIGLIAGYGFLFKLIGEITLWPIPGHWQIELPADERAWRAAHIGNVTNGLMCLGIGVALHRLRLSAGMEKFVTWGVIAAIWGNVGFYVFAALGATGRGLTFGANRFGGGDPLSVVAFLVGYPGAFVLPVAVAMVVRAAFAAAREAGGRK